MTKLLLSLLLASSFSALANKGDFCEGLRCTANMQLVATEFETYTKFPTEPLAVAYSGSCFMIEPGLDPEAEHHGLFMFETANGYTSGTGLHQYFGSNAYEGKTFAEIKAVFEKRGQMLNPIIVTPNEATLTFKFEDQNSKSTINHYFRSSDDEKTMIWLTEWITTNGMKRIFCRLQRNP